MITTGQFRLEFSGELGHYRGKVPVEAEQFDIDLIQDARFPANAWDAPVASWVLARLAYEAKKIGASFNPPDKEGVDGGGYAFDVRVHTLDGPEVGGFQLQGDTCGVAILGSCVESVNPGDILAAFSNLLFANPDALSECVIKIYDPEWQIDETEYQPTPDEDTINRYGWNGSQLLGAGNIWCESDFGAPRPKHYRDYLTLCSRR